jgi:quinol-cytochrome oxidoreductase complex cytochrome b subunit
MTFTIPVIIVISILAWVLRPREKLTNSRRLTILATVIPPGVVAVAAIVFQLLHNAAGKTSVSDISNTLFIIGLGLIGVAILTLAGFAGKRKGEVAKSIGFGLCIAVVLSIIEFALLEGLAGV